MDNIIPLVVIALMAPGLLLLVGIVVARIFIGQPRNSADDEPPIHTDEHR